MGLTPSWVAGGETRGVDGGARAALRRDVEARGGDRSEGVEHAGPVLVAECAEDERDVGRRDLQRAHVAGEGLGAIGIVRGVEQEAVDGRAGGGDALEAARPTDRREPAPDRIGRRADARPERRCDARVVVLVVAGEADRVRAERDPEGRRPSSRRAAWATASMAARISGATGPRTISSPGFAIPAFSRAMSRSVAPSRSVWSSAIRVIAAARGTAQDVGRVEPSTDADLDDRDVHLRVAKREERRERGRLEERELRRPVERACERRGEHVVVDRLAVRSGCARRTGTGAAT